MKNGFLDFTMLLLVSYCKYITVAIHIYVVLLLAICEGECESNHPHSYIYDAIELSFEITGK